MRLLSQEELDGLLPAETAAFPGPIPTQSVSSDEFMPAPQTEQQRRVEARIKALGSALGQTHGMTRRQFLATASGMAAAFVVMNEVYGTLYSASLAEAAAFGCLIASITIQQLGVTGTASPEQVRQRWREVAKQNEPGA